MQTWQLIDLVVLDVVVGLMVLFGVPWRH